MATITVASSTVILIPFSQLSDNSSTSPFFLAYRTLSGKNNMFIRYTNEHIIARDFFLQTLCNDKTKPRHTFFHDLENILVAYW